MRPPREHQRVCTRSAEARCGEACELIDELVWEPLLVDGWVRRDSALVVPVAAGGAGARVVACREPFLRQVSEPEIVGCAGSTHLRWHPARVDGVAEDVRPEARDGGSERG